MSALTEFWNEDRWGNYFGQRRIVNGVVSIHSGRDIKGGAGGGGIPLLDGGTVTKVGRLADVGGFFEIRVADDRWDTYCHVVPDIVEGGTYERGEVGSFVAGWDDDHGALWTGPHLHFMTADSAGAWAVRPRAQNPDPVIRAALAAGGGASGGGLSNDDDDEEESEQDMFEPKLVVRTDGSIEASLVAPWLEGPSALERGYIVLTSEDEISACARLFVKGAGSAHASVPRDGGYTTIQDVARVLHARWKASAVPGVGGAVDLEPLIAEIRALGTSLGGKIDALPAEIDRFADGKKQG